MKRTRFIELDLNKDTLENREVFAAKKQEATGDELVKIINANPGVSWLSPEKATIRSVKESCEEIVERREIGTLDFKLAKAILKVIKNGQQKNVARKGRPKRAGR